MPPFYTGSLSVFCFCVKTLHASQCRFCVSFVTLSGPYKNAEKHACRKPEIRKKSEIEKTETEIRKRKNKNRTEKQKTGKRENPEFEKMDLKNRDQKTEEKNQNSEKKPEAGTAKI